MNPLRIAFISSHPKRRRFRQDASFIYRCENLALALAHLGHRTSLLHLTSLIFRTDFDIAVFLRPTRSWLFDWVVKRLRARGVMLIGDADDLIFDPACAEFRPSVMNRQNEVESTRRKFTSHASAMKKMDRMQFSTGELVRRYVAQQPEAVCTVIPNAAYRPWRNLAPPAPSTQRSISYFSGTRTHDRDFAIVAPVLERLLEAYEDLTVRIVGPVAENLRHPRVIKIAKVAFTDYPALVQSSHISIAPLEDTPFNQCKSALKSLEAAMMNVPTVVSTVGDYANLSLTGVLHANSEQEWQSQLEFALDPDNYRELSTGLNKRMLEVADIDLVAQDFLQFATR